MDNQSIKEKALAIVNAIFSESYHKELNSGVYFEKGCDKPCIQEIETLNSSLPQFVSLFEAALIIGFRIDPVIPNCLIHSCVDLFVHAVLHKEIDPRHPLTHIPYSKLPKTHTIVDGEIIAIKESPDLSWTMTLKEVAEFAIYKGYPEENFQDLIVKQIEETSKQVKKQKNVTTELSTREINSIFKILLGMAMDKYGYDPEAKRNTATGENKNSILSSVQLCGLNTDPETIKKFLKMASETHPEAKLPEKK